MAQTSLTCCLPRFKLENLPSPYFLSQSITKFCPQLSSSSPLLINQNAAALVRVYLRALLDQHSHLKLECLPSGTPISKHILPNSQSFLKIQTLSSSSLFEDPLVITVRKPPLHVLRTWAVVGTEGTGGRAVGRGEPRHRVLCALMPDSQDTCEKGSSAQSDWHQDISTGK